MQYLSVIRTGEMSKVHGGVSSGDMVMVYIIGMIKGSTMYLSHVYVYGSDI